VTLERVGALPRLLAGPGLERGAEPYASHISRLGPVPSRTSRKDLIGSLDSSGLLGRGGAGFPVGRKWRSVADRAVGSGAVVLVNGAEGEPLSHKDRALMTLRPHLVLDGAEAAADAVGADEIVLYIGETHSAARASIERAYGERPRRPRGSTVRIRLAVAPDRYIAGEESAAVQAVNIGDARPTTTPPRPYERGIAGLPTLVQNVESLAHVALIARYGPDWYRDAGRWTTRGTAVVTVTGSDGQPEVREIELGTTIGELAALPSGGGGSGGSISPDSTQAVLLGGYFGGWLAAREAWDLPLDPASLRAAGRSLGAGIVAFLPSTVCPVGATARIADYMAGQSAAQCGPCVFGLRAIADAMLRLARRSARPDDLSNLERWASQVRNRGACRHPDGAIGMLVSALETFGDEVLLHQRAKRCSFLGTAERAAPPAPLPASPQSPAPVAVPRAAPASLSQVA
jgi:NADH:ubiquinone oxidoreductase subunit F (NADH-binding)